MKNKKPILNYSFFIFNFFRLLVSAAALLVLLARTARARVVTANNRTFVANGFLLHGATVIEVPCTTDLVEFAKFVVVAGNVTLLEAGDEFDPADVLFFFGLGLLDFDAEPLGLTAPGFYARFVKVVTLGGFEGVLEPCDFVLGVSGVAGTHQCFRGRSEGCLLNDRFAAVAICFARTAGT